MYYLPLTGGTLTGGLTRDTYLVSNIRNNSYVAFNGGTSSTAGGVLELYGKEHATQPGSWALRARSENTYHTLFGKVNGDLLWDSFDVVTSNNINTFTAGGSNFVTGTLSWDGGTNITLPAYGTWDVLSCAAGPYFQSKRFAGGARVDIEGRVTYILAIRRA